MITYAQHLAFLDREIQRAWAQFQEYVAEQQGMVDAYEFGEGRRAYNDARQRDRYELGVQIGLMKLLLERLEAPCEQTECQSDRLGTPSVASEVEGG